MKALTRRPATEAQAYVSNLAAPLVHFGTGDAFTLGEAFQGVQVFGGTGSGKTSGSGRALAHAFLRHGFGGLVLCAKPDEAALWEAYAKATGRSDSVLIIRQDSPWVFNFLSYILCKEGIEASVNAVDVLMRAAEASRLAKDRPSGEGDQFWELAMRQALMNAIPVLYAAYGRVVLSELYEFLRSAPQSEAEANDAKWQDSAYFYATVKKASTDPAVPWPRDSVFACAAYWRFDFARLDPKTRGNIVITLTSLLARFFQGRLNKLFCTHTTFVPDLTFEGVILVLDLPVKTWQEDGIIAQHIIKYLWQRAVEARAAKQGSAALRPVFLWADESQFFINSYDAEFQSTARSSRAATVYITQSLPTYYAKIGGQQPEHYANMLLANLMTKVFHANGCYVTNRWAADTIGMEIVRRRTVSSGTSEGNSHSWSRGTQKGTSANWSSGSTHSYSSKDSSHGGSVSSGGGVSAGRNRGYQYGVNLGSNQGVSDAEQKDYKLEPADFASLLRTGGARHGGRVDAIWFQPTHRYTLTRSNFTPVTFTQEGIQ